jgi:2-polyprenyl-6-methoxyphenol hydroxylase-like FAD-dependent oxidoreductase
VSFDELTGGRYVTLARSELSRLLFERISNSTEVIFGDEIVGFQEQENGVIARFRHEGDRRFDLMIGADGLHSRVRRLAFGAQDQFEKQLGYAVAAFEIAGYDRRDDDVYVIHGQPGRMLGRVSLRDDRTLFLFVFAIEQASLPATRDLQRSMLRARYGNAGWEFPRILEALAGSNDLYFDRVSQITMPGWSRGRIALVGDAAFCVSLLAGQGAALAMISAYVLAGELSRADGSYQDAFARYEGRLRGYIDRKQQAAARFASAFAPRTRLGLAFRKLVVRAFAVPGLARIAFGRDIADQIQLPDYRWPSTEDRGALSQYR